MNNRKGITVSDKFVIQDNLYQFPYHYIPHFESDGLPRITRVLRWGIEYLTYMTVVKETVERLPGNTILDIGCGDGYLLNSIKKPGVKKLGVDVSERPIKFAQAFATDAEFQLIDIFEMDDKHDVVVLTEVMEHIPDDQIHGFVEQSKRLVAPGGHLVITVPTTVVSLNKKHHRHYDEELLDRHFGSVEGWKLIQDYRVYSNSPRLKRRLRLLSNRLWIINARTPWARLWKWHCRHTLQAKRHHGQHIVRVYERANDV